MDIKKKEFALVALCLEQAKSTKLWAKQVVGSHLEHQSTLTNPMLTALHLTSREQGHSGSYRDPSPSLHMVTRVWNQAQATRAAAPGMGK